MASGDDTRCVIPGDLNTGQFSRFSFSLLCLFRESHLNSEYDGLPVYRMPVTDSSWFLPYMGD